MTDSVITFALASLRSVEELIAARDAGELETILTDVVVTAPVVSWPDDPSTLLSNPMRILDRPIPPDYLVSPRSRNPSVLETIFEADAS